MWPWRAWQAKRNDSQNQNQNDGENTWNWNEGLEAEGAEQWECGALHDNLGFKQIECMFKM